MSVADVTLNTSSNGKERAKYVSIIDVHDPCRTSTDLFKGCNLSALLEAMQEEFSRQPPVYAKPKDGVLHKPAVGAPVRPPSSQPFQNVGQLSALCRKV